MNKFFKATLIGIFSIILLAACREKEKSPASTVIQPITARELQIVTGQTIYVPAYSEIFTQSHDHTIKLTVTLAIHNSDPDSPIIVQSVRYFDTEGKLVRDYIDEPVQVPPLATAGFVVEESDTSGGWGANFLVDWGAEKPVYEPVIEAVMINTSTSTGVSMISPGRVVSQTTSDD